MRSLLSTATQLFGPQINTDTNEALFNCPECGRAKLYVNTNKGVFFCVRCEHTGDISKKQQIAPFITTTTNNTQRKLLPPTLRDIKAVPVYSSDLLAYLYQRKFTSRQIARMQIQQSDFVGPIKLSVVDSTGEHVDTVIKWINLTGAVIFPIFDGGYRGYQARYIYATSKDKRWLSAPGVSRKSLLFNADQALAKHNDTVYIAEGIPAACAFGSQGVATFGKGYSQPQLERLCSAPQTKFYIAYDGDVPQKAHKLGLTLTELGKKVLVIPFRDGEDPDSIDDLADRIVQAIPPTVLKAPTTHFHKHYRATHNKRFRNPSRPFSQPTPLQRQLRLRAGSL